MNLSNIKEKEMNQIKINQMKFVLKKEKILINIAKKFIQHVRKLKKK